MTFQLNFQQKGIYYASNTGIKIETTLRYNALEFSGLANIDTGSASCIFSRSVADSLEIYLTNGYPRTFNTLTGDFAAFGHNVELETMGLILRTMVFFIEDPKIHKNLLGRDGWFQFIKFGLNHSSNEVFLGNLEEVA
jgi:hypothetical protein